MQRFLGAFVLILALFTMIACSPRNTEAKPETNPVKGVVAYKSGKPYTERSSIEFRHADKDGPPARGAVNEKGEFALFTVTAQHRVEGAVEGSYVVTIFPSGTDQTVGPIELKKKYAVTKGDNNLTVVIDD